MRAELMSSSATEVETNIEDAEAFETLVGRAVRRTGKVPPEVVARHVLAIVPASEWAVRVEAMDAILRRFEASREEKLRVEARPPGDRLLGLWSTRRPGSGSRPYRTVLIGLNPIETRCDCPDFLRSSLGVCKHGLVVLEHLYAHPRLLQQAIKEQEWGEPPGRMGLWWDPIRPLTGLGDWMERVGWRGDTEAVAARSARAARALRWFRAPRDGVAAIKNPHHGDPKRRLAMVEDLLAVIPAGASGLRHDPAVRALLLRERQRLRLIVDQALSPAELRHGLHALKRPLYPYQREGVNRFLAEGRLLLADDMGLGKTAQAIAACGALWRSGRVRRGLIITPASLKPQWAREWAAFSTARRPTARRSTPRVRKVS
jgi:hypothetical protein